MIPAPSATRHASGFMARLHAALAHYRTAVLLAALALWGLSFWIGGQIHTDNSSLAFFPDADPHMARMAQAMDMAPFSRLLLVDFAAAQEDQAARLAETADAVLRALPPQLARRAAEIRQPDPAALLRLVPLLVDEVALRTLEDAVRPDAVHAALSQARITLAGLWGSVSVPWVRQDPLNFRRILLERLPQPPGVSLPDPTLGFPLSRDGKHVLLTLRPTSPLHDVDSAVTLMDALDAALKAHTPPGVTVTVVGAHRHSAANARSITNDIRHIVLWSLAGFTVVYALLVRSVPGIFWLLLTPLAASSFAIGGLSLGWSVISGLALGFGASVLGIAEDYAVHMHFALRCAKARDQDTGTVLNMLALPLSQGFLLNASGFVVLLFSGIPALRQLAAFALLTLSAGLLLALVVLPLCPGFDRPPLLPRSSGPPLPLVPRPAPATACALGLLLLCAVLWPGVRLDISPRGLGAGVAAMQEDAAMLRKVWGGTVEQLWVVQGEDRDSALENTRRVAAALRASGQGVDTLADIWPAPEQLRANLIRWRTFVETHPDLGQRMAAEGQTLGFSAETFAPFSLWLTESLPDQHGMDASLRTAGLGDMVDTFLEAGADKTGAPRAFSLIMAKGESGAADVGLLPPELRELATPLSPSALEAALLRHLEREGWLLPVAGLICAILLYLCFGWTREALLATVPPLAALAAILAWLGWSDTPLTLAGMAALPLVLGLAIDHGVVITHDMRHGIPFGVDRAIVTSSLTALTGMGLLALAEHPALRSMGQVIFLGLTVEMFAALWLLPRLCAPRSKENNP